MDTRTGQIYTSDRVQGMSEDERPYMKPMALEMTREQRRRGRVGRNDPCPCGSGQKFKRCCFLRRFTPGH
jgi:uncharacterized protein YecA (UPF0149 family)